MRRVIVLGSTGSIGVQALEVIAANPDRFELVGTRFSFELRPRPEVVDFRDEGSPPLVGGERAIEVVCAALSRERGTPSVGIRSRGLEIDHERSLERVAPTTGAGRRQLPATDEMYAATSAIC